MVNGSNGENNAYKDIKDMINEVDEKASKNYNGNRLHRAMCRGIKNLFEGTAIRWFDVCIRQYDEDYFHKRLALGFSFIQDMKENHFSYYNAVLTKGREVGKFYTLDVDEMFLKLEKLVTVDLGWTLYQHERDIIKKDLELFSYLIKGVDVIK